MAENILVRLLLVDVLVCVAKNLSLSDGKLYAFAYFPPSKINHQAIFYCHTIVNSTAKHSAASDLRAQNSRDKIFRPKIKTTISNTFGN